MIEIDIEFSKATLPIPGESGLFLSLAKNIAKDHGFSCSASKFEATNLILEFRRLAEMPSPIFCNFLDDINALARLHGFTDVTIPLSQDAQ